MNQPKVSVIVAVYNIEKYLEPSFQSIVRQTLKEIEVILVDDGSKDSSGKICDEYAAKYPHFKVIHKENGGLATARNAGMDAAQGEYLYFMDGDDWIEDNLLEENYNMISTGNYDVLVFGHVKEFHTSSGTNYINTVPPKLDVKNREELKTQLVKIMNSGNGFAVWEQFYRTDFVKENNLRYPIYKRGADMAFLCELYAKANSMITNPKVYYHYLAFPSASKFSPQVFPNHLEFYQRFLNMFDDWLEYKENKQYSLKLLLLWFCHVIPTNIIGNQSFTYQEKRQKLGEILSNKQLNTWIEMFSFKDANGMISTLMLAVLKTKSSFVLYHFTNFKSWFKNNIKVDYKKLFYKK